MSDYKAPEYWTAENTAAWIAETWGNPEEWTGAQREWGEKLRGGSRAGPACYRPLTAQELTAMRAKDPRPANACYFDGTPIREYKPLVPAKKRAKKAA